MPLKLPNELVDALIASVAGNSRWLSPEDKQTLRSCTLVSRDCLPASRVVNAEERRPWLASIRRLTFKDQWCRYRGDGRSLPPKPLSRWRGQYLIPILASRLPNLEHLSLSVDWGRLQPHPSTLGMFASFTALSEFLSFSAFRRILASLPALKNLTCKDVHWPSAPNPLSWPFRPPGLRSKSCAFLEWLIHTPTRSTLVEWGLDSDWLGPPEHQWLPDRNLDYYAQVFGPSICRMTSDQYCRTDDIIGRISLSSFDKLSFLSLRVDGADWQGVVDMLRLLPSRLTPSCSIPTLGGWRRIMTD
ncbi:hypothetical protein V8D89_014870 [Ganoderma adspersum]